MENWYQPKFWSEELCAAGSGSLILERLAGSGLSFLAFSGYTLREIRSQPFGPAILKHLDVLVAGRFVAGLVQKRGLMGSSNQAVHLLSGRYTWDAVAAVPSTEIILHKDGSITLTGIAPWGREHWTPS